MFGHQCAHLGDCAGALGTLSLGDLLLEGGFLGL
jgi:hypothetical protein